MQEEERYKPEGRIRRLKRAIYSRINQPKARPRRKLLPKQPKISQTWQIQQNKSPISEKFDTKAFAQEVSEGIAVDKQMQVKKPGSLWLFVLSLIFVFVSVAVAVFVFIGESYNADPAKIMVDVQGPSSIESGDILELHIQVANTNNITLEQADLLIEYPPGTRIPENPSSYMHTQRIQLGSLPPGTRKTGTVRAAVFGKEGTATDIKIELEYRAKNSSAIKTKEVHFPIMFTSSPLSLSVSMLKEAVSGQFLELEVSLLPQSKLPMSDVVLEIKYPFGFEALEFSEAPIKNDNFWYIGDLKPGEEKKIIVRGKLIGQEADEKTFRFIAGFRREGEKWGQKEEDTPNEVATELATLKKTVVVNSPFLVFEPKVGDETLKQKEKSFYVGKTSETLPIEITWKNILQESIYNLTIAASVYGNAADPYNISPEKGFYDSKNSIAVWNKTTSGEFAEVSAGQEGKVILRITPLPKEKLVGKSEPKINVDLNAAAQRISETGVRESLKSVTEIPIRIESDVDFDAQALYFNNPFVSYGPIPPRIHQETHYAIKWQIKNTTNKIQNATVVATLPLYVKWLGMSTPASENVKYNQIDRTVTWYVGDLEPNTGYGDNSPREVIFNISFTPSASQYNTTPTLIENQKFSGYDTFTETTINTEADDLTTNLTEEGFIDGQGTVK